MNHYSDDGRIPTLVAALNQSMTVGDLKKLGALTGEKLPTRKAEIAAAIDRYLGGERLRAVWQSLDELQKAAVAEVVHSASFHFSADRFRAKYGQDPIWGEGDEYGYVRRPSRLAFFFYGGRVMPDDLKARLKAFVPLPAKTEIRTIRELPADYELPLHSWERESATKGKRSETVSFIVHESERIAQRELHSVLRVVDSGKVTVGDKTRRPSAAATGAVTGILEGGDYYPPLPVKGRRDENAGPIRAFAWPMLVQAAGLAQLSGTKLQLTKAGRAAFAAPAADTLRAIWSKWVGTTIIDELSRIDCVKGQTGKGKHGLTAVSSRRRAIADALRECPAGSWVWTDELDRFMRASGRDLVVTRSAWELYIIERQYGSLGYENSQEALERRYLYCFLLEYAATLGLIDVALIPPAGARTDYDHMWGTDDLAYFSRYDGLIALRLTRLGAYCLGVAAEYETPPVQAKPVLWVLPNHEVAAVGTELAPGDRLALDAYATKVSELVWRLDAAMLLAAVEDGRSIDELREFLTARSGAAIPGNVERLFKDVEERSVKVRNRGLARLAECADPDLAALIANDTRTRKYCMRAGERHLAVPSSFEAAFRRALREVGYILNDGHVREPRE